MRRLGFVVVLMAATSAAAFAAAAADAVKHNLLAFTKLTSYHMAVDTSGKTIDVDMVNPNNQENFTATDLGMKTVGGSSLHAYLVKNKDASKPATMYFDSAGMLARIEIDGDKGGTTAIVYSKYNAPIKIEAPI